MDVQGNGQPFDPIGGITIAGYYYFLSGGPDLFELYRHWWSDIPFDFSTPPIAAFTENYDPIEVLIVILTDRKNIAERSRDDNA